MADKVNSGHPTTEISMDDERDNERYERLERLYAAMIANRLNPCNITWRKVLAAMKELEPNIKSSV